MPVFDVFKRKSAKAHRPSRDAAVLGGEHRLMAVLDIGTSTVRCAVVDERGGGLELLSFSRVQHLDGAMAGGVIIDIERVLESVERAWRLALVDLPVNPERAIAGIAGEHVRGRASFIASERSHPEQRITAAELRTMIDHLERKAVFTARRDIAWEQGKSEVDLRILHATLLGIRIDGQTVSNPLHFQGRTVELQVYHGFAPLVNLGAIQTVVSELGLGVEAVAAEPYALAYATTKASTNTDDERRDALVIDVGAGTTDIALVRGGGVEATRSFAFAGDDVTRHIMHAFSIGRDEAEAWKIGYTEGTIPAADHKKIQKILVQDQQLWRTGLIISLEELAQGRPLPTTVVLGGGGALLPEIALAITGPWTGEAGLEGELDVHVLTPSDIAIVDRKHLARDSRDVMTLALATLMRDLPDGSVAAQAFDRVRRMIAL